MRSLKDIILKHRLFCSSVRYFAASLRYSLLAALIVVQIFASGGRAETIDLMQRVAGAGGREVETVWGPVGPAWHFDGSENSNVGIAGVKFPRAFTFETWLKFDPDSVDGCATILSSDKDRRFRLFATEGENLTMEFKNLDKGTSRYQCAYRFTPGRWYHLVVSMSPDEGIAFHVNGELVKIQHAPVPGMDSFPVSSIGAYSIGQGLFDHHFRGSIGGSRLYDKVLSSEEIRKISRTGLRVPSIVPIPRHALYLEGEKAFPLKGNLSIQLEEGFFPGNDPVLGEFVQAWKTNSGGVAEVSSGSGNASLQLTVKRGDPGAGLFGDELLEAYKMKIDSDSVEITAFSKRGVAYALYSLIAMIENRSPEIPAVEICDWPEFPFRGFLYLCHREPPAMLEKRFEQDMQKLIPKLAKHRVNYLMIRTADWIMLDDPKIREAAKRLASLAAEYHLDILPLSRSYGHAKQFLWRDLRTGHTDTVANEEVRISGTQPVALRVPNVIVTKHTPIVVKSRGGKIYEEKKDYLIIDGDLKTKWDHPPGTASSWSRPFVLPENKPWQIQRIENSSIADGETVLVTYDTARVVRGQGHGSYNPFSEFTRNIQSESIEGMTEIVRNNLLNSKFINYGLDEVWVMRGEGRSSTHNNWSNEETFVYEANLLDQETRSRNPEQRMMMWSDMIDPRQTPGWRDTLDYRSIMANLSREIVLMPWFYGTTSDDIAKINGSLRFFTKEGFQVVGTSGHEPLNNLLWGEALFNVKHKLGGGALGILYTTWAGGGGDVMGGLPAFAQASWSPGQVKIDAASRLVELLRQAGLDTSPGSGRRENISKEGFGKASHLGIIPIRIKAVLAEVKEDMIFMGEERLEVLKRVGFDIPSYYSLGEEFLRNVDSSN